jgi:serine/threonine-protein kinase
MTPTPAPAGTTITTRTVAPATIGHYALLRVIASGAMGTLYESVDLRTGSKIALKLLHRSLPAAADRLAAGLAHPGIVSVYDYGEHAGDTYIAMEYVNGRSLRDCFERKVAFSIADSVGILSQLLDALQYAHERGVWHRDIKPGNVLISHSGQIKIADFGIARAERSTPDGSEDVMGTPGYIAPETYLSVNFDQRVDLFC